MNVRRNLIAAVIAVLLTGIEFTALRALAGNAESGVHRIAVPDTTIPMLPEIKVRPTPEQVHAAFAGASDMASTTHPDDVMPFYSFAVKPVAATKG